jgi:hypothetical protein
MGLLERIFGRANQYIGASRYFKTLTGYAPVFTSWNGQLYEQYLVRSAIHARATHISKLKISFQGNAKLGIIRNLTDSPNSWQTWSQLLYRTSTILDMQNTAFLVPVMDQYLNAVGVYTILPSRCELREHNGEIWLRYAFANGQYAAVEFSRCRILTKFQYDNDFFGASNAALNPIMQLIHIQNQGIQEGVKSAATYRFMARLTNFKSDEDLKKERKSFTEANLSAGDGGVLLFPNTYDSIQQITSKPFVVDDKQMAAIEKNVHGYFGTNDEILQNKAYGDVMSAFVEGVVEPFGINFTDGLAWMLFSKEQRIAGNKVHASCNRLQYMTNADKMKFSQGMADRGLALRDEIREMWNLPPLPDGLGKTLPIRGEYYDLTKQKKEDPDNA